jgi:hypothetical protein
MPKHKIKVWSTCIDRDAPLSSQVFTSENEAWSSVIAFYLQPVSGDDEAYFNEESEKAHALLDAGDIEGLRALISEIRQETRLQDDYTVDDHEIEVDLPWPSDECVSISDDQRDWNVSVSADVIADSATDATQEFVKELQIGNTDGLTYHVSNLKTGEYVEIDA